MVGKNSQSHNNVMWATTYSHEREPLFVCLLHAQEYKNITKKRLAYLMLALPQPDQFSVLVRAIPKPGNENESYSKEVEDFFQRFHPLHYLSHQMVFPASKLQSLLVCVLLPSLPFQLSNWVVFQKWLGKKMPCTVCCIPCANLLESHRRLAFNYMMIIMKCHVFFVFFQHTVAIFLRWRITNILTYLYTVECVTERIQQIEGQGCVFEGKITWRKEAMSGRIPRLVWSTSGPCWVVYKQTGRPQPEDPERTVCHLQ